VPDVTADGGGGGAPGPYDGGVPETLAPALEPTAPTLPAAVLWDMDGTLVDTEPYWIAAEHELVAEHGGTWSDEQALQMVGNALTVSAAILRDQGGVDLPVDEIVERLLRRVIEQVRVAVPWQPGALDLLTALAGEVVSRAPAGSFATIVTGDQVTRGKPDPEPYLLAAERLGVDAGACVAIEDSPTGIASARAAGVTTLGVEAVLPVPRLEGLSRVSSLEKVDVATIARIRAGQVVDLTA
jgi:beta-phosphoglucomutase-like phosphatase (HAD superfamily)